MQCSPTGAIITSSAPALAARFLTRAQAGARLGTGGAMAKAGRRHAAPRSGKGSPGPDAEHRFSYRGPNWQVNMSYKSDAVTSLRVVCPPLHPRLCRHGNHGTGRLCWCVGNCRRRTHSQFPFSMMMMISMVPIKSKEFVDDFVPKLTIQCDRTH